MFFNTARFIFHLEKAPSEPDTLIRLLNITNRVEGVNEKNTAYRYVNNTLLQ